MNIIKQLKRDLIDNYSTDDLLAMARLHKLNIDQTPLDVLIDRIAAANLRHSQIVTGKMKKDGNILQELILEYTDKDWDWYELSENPITRLNELYKAKELSNGFPLRWRDAIYSDVELFVPKLNSHPSTAEVGQVYYSDTNRSFYVYYNGGWINVNDAPLIQLSPYPDLNPTFDEMGKQTNLQKVWYVCVYGYPSKIGRPYDGFLNSVKLADLKRAPQRYGAEIVGQGVNFVKKKAKKKAAQEALDFLERRGVKK